MIGLLVGRAILPAAAFQAALQHCKPTHNLKSDLSFEPIPSMPDFRQKSKMLFAQPILDRALSLSRCDVSLCRCSALATSNGSSAIHVEARERRVLCHRNANGRFPYREWRNSLNHEDTQVVVRGYSPRQDSLEGLQTAESRLEKPAVMVRPAEDERAELIGRLKDPQYFSKYLSASFGDSAGTLLMALRNVANAQKGMSQLAAEAGVNRENLCRMLSEQGNPRRDTPWAVLKAIGLRVSLEPASAPPTRPARE
jgi:probable addiction module antidote protein